MNKDEVKITYRGWQGHFIGRCDWHLNTLLEFPSGKKIVVSTVGNCRSSDSNEYSEIGVDRLFETMAFESDYGEWDDADVTKQIYLDSEWTYNEEKDQIYLDSEWTYNEEKDAQNGHILIIEELINKYK